MLIFAAISLSLWTCPSWLVKCVGSYSILAK